MYSIIAWLLTNRQLIASCRLFKSGESKIKYICHAQTQQLIKPVSEEFPFSYNIQLALPGIASLHSACQNTHDSKSNQNMLCTFPSLSYTFNTHWPRELTVAWLRSLDLVDRFFGGFFWLEPSLATDSWAPVWGNISPNELCMKSQRWNTIYPVHIPELLAHHTQITCVIYSCRT